MGRHIQNQSQMLFTCAQGVPIALSTGTRHWIWSSIEHIVATQSCTVEFPNKCLSHIISAPPPLFSTFVTFMQWDSQRVSVSPRLWLSRLRWVAGSWPLLWCCLMRKHHSNPPLYFFRLQIFQEFNCPALSHAAVSISCMACAGG